MNNKNNNKKLKIIQQKINNYNYEICVFVIKLNYNFTVSF